MADNAGEKACQDPLVGPRRSGQGGNKVTESVYTMEHEKEEPTKTRTPLPTYVPPDGGWGWMVAVGTTVCNMILSTQGPCFGILFGPRLRELQAPPSLPSWLFNFQSMIWNLAGPWTGPLSAKFSYRKVSFVAALFSAASLFVSSLVSSPYLLLLTFSVLNGIGGGISITCCYHVLPQYFKERLGVANSIMLTGGSVGIILLPQFASHLQDLYPFTWATLITGAVTLNAAVGSLLFHPVEWHLTKKTLDTKGPELFGSPSATDDAVPHREPCSLLLHDGADAEPDQLQRTKTYSESQCHSLKEGKVCGTVTPGAGSPRGSFVTLSGQEGEQIGVWQQFRNHYKPSVLKDPLVISVALVNCVTMAASLNVFSSIPFVLHEAGYTLQESATAMSLAAVVDLVTRMACGVITDLPQFKPRVLFGFAQIIFIVVPFALLTWSDQWFVVLGCAGAFGMGLGVLYILDVLIMIQLLGADKFQSVLGVSQLLRSVAFISIGPVGGAIREASGDYWATLAFFSCCMLFAFLVMLCTAVTLRPRRQAQNGDRL